MGDTWSVAWRVLDAQFWGVPQRRRRIALVADFGGQSAPEILFIRKGVSRNLDESEPKRKATARDASDRTGADDRYGAVGFPLGFRPENVRCYDEVATTLCNGTRPGFTTGVIQPVASYNIGDRFSVPAEHIDMSPTLTARMGTGGNNVPAVTYPTEKYLFENHSQDSRYKGPLDVSPMLSAQLGTGGNNTPLVMEPLCFEPGDASRLGGYCYEDQCGTLRASMGDNQFSVAYSINHQGGNVEQIIEDKAGTLTAAMNSSGNNKLSVAYGIQGSMIGRADHNGPQGDGVNEDVSFTLNTTDRHAVVYGISPYHSNCMKSDNPHSGYYEADTARTLDALQCGYPGCNQGGMAVVERSEEPIVIDRAFFNQGKNAQYEPQVYTDGTVPTLIAKGPSAVQVRYIVRRLTPLECERLQGYPDGWTDIGEWVDSNGKKHKEADSPRYKALGNSIAIPPWKWVLKRLCACYERDATMASLFDGIGGFPYIWEQLNGNGSCLWASEIEEFPMAVTKLRFGG